MAATKKRVTREGWYGANGKVRRGLPNLAAFHRELDRLLARHFTKDEDGDYPVRVHVIDRTTHETAVPWPLPHLHDLAPGTEQQTLVDALWVVGSNLSLAFDQHRRVSYAVEQILRKKEGS